MNNLKRLDKGYYTQTAEVAIEERIFVKEVAGMKATKEYFREATEEELAQWEELKKKQEEEHQAMMGHESSNA
jgi:hypothetical protein